MSCPFTFLNCSIIYDNGNAVVVENDYSHTVHVYRYAQNFKTCIGSYGDEERHKAFEDADRYKEIVDSSHEHFVDIHERKTDCFNCQFCHDSEDGSRCACLVVAGGKPTPKEQVKAYLSGSAESCPVRSEIKYC